MTLENYLVLSTLFACHLCLNICCPNAPSMTHFPFKTNASFYTLWSLLIVLNFMLSFLPHFFPALLLSSTPPFSLPSLPPSLPHFYSPSDTSSPFPPHSHCTFAAVCNTRETHSYTHTQTHILPQTNMT